ncbi:Ankyrin repeat-containing domain protein [Elaphomyces granulatus]
MPSIVATIVNQRSLSSTISEHKTKHGISITSIRLARKACDEGSPPPAGRQFRLRGIDPNFVGGSLRAAPLLLAAERGHGVIVELLLAVVHINADVRDVRDHNWGYTPLIYACKEGHVSIVGQLLARHDVDFNARGTVISIPLTIASKCNRVEIIKLLLAKGDSLDPTIVGINAAFYGFMKLLLDHPGVDPNFSGEDGNTAFIYVLQNILGKTALFEAANFSHVECVKLLLERGDINVNIPNRDGLTMLHYACYSDNPLEIMELLLERDDINPNALDGNGDSVFTHFMNRRDLQWIDSHFADRIESLLRAAGPDILAL